MRLYWLAVLGFAVGAVAPAGADEWSRQYTVKGKPDVHVRAADGRVKIEPGAASEVSAQVVTSGWRIGPGDVVITESQTGDRVDIEVRLPKVDGGWTNRSIDMTLRVPAESGLEIRTGDGGIDARALSGRIRLSTGDGKITVDGLKGELDLHTGDGTITGTGLAGRLEASTGDGDVDVRGRFTGLAVRTGDGDVDASVDAGSKVEAPWSVRTGDGNVTLRLPEGLDASLDAHTGDGGIVVDKPLAVTGEVREDRVRGQLGAGGQTLTINTGDGRIHLTGR